MNNGRPFRRQGSGSPERPHVFAVDRGLGAGLAQLHTMMHLIVVANTRSRVRAAPNLRNVVPAKEGSNHLVIWRFGDWDWRLDWSAGVAGEEGFDGLLFTEITAIERAAPAEFDPVGETLPQGVGRRRCAAFEADPADAGFRPRAFAQ
jgi:hypothetical protein